MKQSRGAQLDAHQPVRWRRSCSTNLKRWVSRLRRELWGWRHVMWRAECERPAGEHLNKQSFGFSVVTKTAILNEASRGRVIHNIVYRLYKCKTIYDLFYSTGKRSVQTQELIKNIFFCLSFINICVFCFMQQKEFAETQQLTISVNKLWINMALKQLNFPSNISICPHPVCLCVGVCLHETACTLLNLQSTNTYQARSSSGAKSCPST